MKLLVSPTSPFVRKVRVMLREIGHADDIEEVSVATTPLAADPVVVAANPLGKIPALLRDDAPTLYDSRVITRFLDAEFDAGLYPEACLWDVLTVEATADAIMDAGVLMAYETRLRPEEYRYADWVEGQWAKIDRALTVLEERWMSHLHRPLDMSQIAIGCALSYVDFRHDARNWRNGRPALASWEAKFAARPSMQETIPT